MFDIDNHQYKGDRHILFVFSGPPKQGTGSQIVIDRHLRRLAADGWKISIVAPESTLIGESFPDAWQIISLPMRRWWWTPFKPENPALLELRLHCWQRECDRALKGERPSAILTVLWSVYALLGAHLSKAWRVPLSVMIHDRQELWAQSEAERRLVEHYSTATLDRAARIWPVSPELGDAYRVTGKPQNKPLLPICEGYDGWVEWKESFKTCPVVAHAGSLHSFQLPNLEKMALALQQVNGTLLLVTYRGNPVASELSQKFANVKYQESFPSNKDVMTFLAENASCILVSYSFDLLEQPWALTSFPSKLVEFAHLGLPIILLAPPNIASSNWAESSQWLGYANDMSSAKISDLLNRIRELKTWEKMSEQSRRVAEAEFDPARIHQQFELELVINR
jgi:glycosyltransferase involved in cell wall biosynthesis